MSVTFTNFDRHIGITTDNEVFQLRKDGISFRSDINNNLISLWFSTELIVEAEYNDVLAPSSEDLTELTQILGGWLDDEEETVFIVSQLEGQQFINDDTVTGFENWDWLAYRTDVNTSNFVALWPDNTNDFTILTSAQQLDVDSTSSNDDNNGNGARVVVLYGLDGNYNEITEDITMNGTSDVRTSQNFLRVNKVRVKGPISGGTVYAKGDIKIKTIGDDLVSKVESDESESMVGLYTVPNNKTLIIRQIVINSNDPTFALRGGFIVLYQVAENNDVPRVLSYHIHNLNTVINLNEPIVVAAKTDLYWEVNRESGTSVLDYSINCRGYLITKN